MNERGFTLIETIVASAVVIATLAGVTHLFLQSARTSAEARRAPVALAAAEAKLEQLLALSWSYDAAGVPVSDQQSDTSVDPPLPSGGTGLAVSPDDSLSRAVPGYVDYLDGSGRPLGATPTGSAVFERRWLIQALAGAPLDGRVLCVCVVRLSGTAVEPPPEVCLGTARTRR